MRVSTTMYVKGVPGRQRGFSLIELMVGMVVGLLAVLVITQVMTLAEGRKRTVSMGADAQVNGALALFAMQRDIAQAGYGTAAIPEALGCPTQYSSSGGSGTFTLAPVVIVDGGANDASDQITVLQANTTNFSAPMGLTENTVNPPTTATPFKVASSLGAVAGNLMVLVPLTNNSTGTARAAAWTSTLPCSVFSVTDDSGSATTALTSTQIPHVNGTGVRAWNQNSVFPAMTVEGDPTVLKSVLLNMGAMVRRTYSISAAGSLQSADLSLTDGSSPAATELYPQIVMLRALYGKATGGGTNPPINTYDKTAPTTNAQWQQVKSIRIAVVARSVQYEKDAVTVNAPVWDVGGSATGTIAVTGASSTLAGCSSSSACLKLDVSTLVGADWQHYRYKVYDTIVPLRNVLWHS
jgi:type IV pilus assembly protein PilW